MKEEMDELFGVLDDIDPIVINLKNALLEMMLKSQKYDTWHVKNLFKSLGNLVRATDEVRTDMLIFETKHIRTFDMEA